MKINFFSILSLLVICSLLFSGCSKDEDEAETPPTTLKVKVLDGQLNEPADNMTVYAISSFFWNGLGADSYRSAEEQVVTDVNGEGNFIISDFRDSFRGDKSQDTYYFLVRYRRGNDNLYAYKGITFQKGEQRVEIITLD